MKLTHPLVFFCFVTSALAEGPTSYIASPEDIRQGYLETLYEKLLQTVKEDNFGAAKIIAAQIEQVSGMEVTSSNIAPCGTWKWVGETMTTLYPGGKVIGNAGTATWKWIDEKQRKFQINWETGWVDNCILSEDSLTLKCRNNRGYEFIFHRVLPEAEKGAETEPGGTPAAGGPAGGTKPLLPWLSD